jgi:hypothetical protein
MLAKQKAADYRAEIQGDNVKWHAHGKHSKDKVMPTRASTKTGEQRAKQELERCGKHMRKFCSAHSQVSMREDA